MTDATARSPWITRAGAALALAWLGAIVPGHGGILDRVDALLVTSAVTFLYSIWFIPHTVTHG